MDVTIPLHQHRDAPNPYLCWYSHCNCTIEHFRKFSTHKKSSTQWRKDFKKDEQSQQEENRKLLNKISGYGCNSSQMLAHFVWIVASKVHGFRTLQEVCRKFLYSSKFGPLLGTMFSKQGFSADSFPLQKLGAWSSERGIFLHPELEFIRDASDYRNYRLKARSDSLLPYLTPLIIVPASCLIGFTDPEDESEKKDMLKGTAIAAGVAIENKMEEQEKKQREQEMLAAGKSSSSSVQRKAEDVCKFFFDSFSLLVNDCLSAENNAASDTRHLFASILLSGTRTLKNAPYLSDKDFSLVGEACPLADIFRHMVHGFVDSGPLSGKVEKPLLQTAVSLALSHSTVLPMSVARSVDNFGNLIRGGVENGMTKIVASPGGLGIIPWLHMLPHGGSVLNAVAISVPCTNDEKDENDQNSMLFLIAKWIHNQIPECGMFENKNNNNNNNKNNRLLLKDVYKNGFVILVACEDIVSDEQVCTQMMAPLNPVRVAPAEKTSSRAKNNNNKNDDDEEATELAKMTLLDEQFELDKEYDETLAMWMVTTASAPNDDKAIPSSEAKYIQSCIADAVINDAKSSNDE